MSNIDTKKNVYTSISSLVKIILVNILIFLVIIIIFEVILRLFHKQEFNIYQLRLNFSYYEMFTPITGTDFVTVAGVTTKRLTPTNPKTGKLLFMFGGSTTVGVESIEKTIASHLTLAATEKGKSLIVENFGVASFRTSEELMKLIKLLRAGFKPDYVLFYDGYNDTEFAIRKQTRYDFLAPIQDVFKSTISIGYIEKVLRQFEVYKLLDSLPYIQGIVRGFLFRIVYRHSGVESIDKIDQFELKSVDDVQKYCVDHYHQNMKMISALGKEYHFIPIFVLQPMIYFKQPLSPTEQKIISDLPKDYKYFTPKLYKAIIDRMSGFENFYVITDVFNRHSETIFTDQGHILSNGNKIVAKRLMEIISNIK